MDRKVYDWIDRRIDGQIETFARQARWRCGWDVVVRRGSVPISLYVRGAREDNYPTPTNLRQEAALHDVFERHGVPAPHVYGVVDDPLAIVMALLPGRINTASVEDEATRQAIRHDFIDIVARVHAIPLAEFAPLGMRIPQGSREIALNLYRASAEIYRKNVGRPLPLMTFIARWQ